MRQVALTHWVIGCTSRNEGASSPPPSPTPFCSSPHTPLPLPAARSHQMQLGESWSSGPKEQVGVLSPPPPSCVAQLTAGVENKPSSLLEYLTQFRLGKRLNNLPLKSFLFWCEGRGAPVPTSPTSPTTPHPNSVSFRCLLAILGASSFLCLSARQWGSPCDDYREVGCLAYGGKLEGRWL